MTYQAGERWFRHGRHAAWTGFCRTVPKVAGTVTYQHFDRLTSPEACSPDSHIAFSSTLSLQHLYELVVREEWVEVNVQPHDAYQMDDAEL